MLQSVFLENKITDLVAIWHPANRRRISMKAKIWHWIHVNALLEEYWRCTLTWMTGICRDIFCRTHYMFCLDTTNSYKYSYVVPIESNRDHKLSPFTVSVSKLATLSSQLQEEMLEALAQRSAWVFCRMSLGHQGRGGYPNPCCGITSTITMLAWIAHAMWCNSLVAAVWRSTTWRCQTRRCRRILTTPQDEAQTRSSLSSNNASVAGIDPELTETNRICTKPGGMWSTWPCLEKYWKF